MRSRLLARYQDGSQPTPGLTPSTARSQILTRSPSFAYTRTDMVRTRFCALAVALFSGFVCAAQTSDASKIIIQRNVPVTMRDGVVLRADIFRPAAEGKFPVLLQRTPYNKSGGSDTGY